MLSLIHCISEVLRSFFFQNWGGQRSGTDATQGAHFPTPSGVKSHLYVSGLKEGWVWRVILNQEVHHSHNPTKFQTTKSQGKCMQDFTRDMFQQTESFIQQVSVQSMLSLIHCISEVLRSFFFQNWGGQRSGTDATQGAHFPTPPRALSYR